MSAPIRRYSQPDVLASHASARAALEQDSRRVVVVLRGRLRNVLFRCPCGCGDILNINLDAGAGPAWRVRFDPDGLTLLPSVWRPDSCRSHFILWKGSIWWCRHEEDESALPPELAIELKNEWRSLRRRRDDVI